jgi:hypothetical protein
LLDVDYILEWLTPTGNDTSFAFILAPSTVVFDHARDLTVNVDFTHATIQLQLDDIYRDTHLLDNGDLSPLSQWHLAGTGIDVRFLAESFELIMRAAPRTSSSPWLTPEDRGGVRFDRIPYADGA